MTTFIEIIKVILPACITGLVTFLVTKYNYHKNIPLDKLEITYNRIYYPIYYLIRNKKEVLYIIEKSDEYLKKCNKYADRSTINAFEFLKANPDDKKAYENYRNNIYEMNGKLRRRLGYLESGIFRIYTYSSPIDKCALRITFELLFIYMSVIVFAIIKNFVLQCIFMVIFLSSLIFFIIDIIKLVLIGVKNILRNMYKRRKSK